MKKRLALMFVMTLVLFASVSMVCAQDDPAPDPPAPVDTPANNDVYVIVCDAEPGQMVVLDSNGVWLSSVRTVEITFTIGASNPKAKCTMWAGPIRPNNPVVENWNLAELKSVAAEEFQEMLDSLQTNPEAVRDRMPN